MGIDQIKGIGPATLKKLDAAGVRTLDDLRSMDTQQLAKSTGIQKRRLDEWRLEARMMKVLDDVKGIGPATKRRLKQADIHSLEDLARASAKQVAHQSRVAQERAKKWQAEARRLLEKTQGQVAEQSASMQNQGAKVAEKARTRTRDAAARGRERAEELAGPLRERLERESQNGEQAREPEPAATGSASGPGQEGSDGAGSPNGGDGDPSGFLTRVRRLFQPRR